MKRATPSTRLRTYDVLPHEGDAAQRWEMHQHGGREHTYFGTQRREAIAAAREQARTHHPAKVGAARPRRFRIPRVPPFNATVPAGARAGPGVSGRTPARTGSVRVPSRRDCTASAVRPRPRSTRFPRPVPEEEEACAGSWIVVRNRARTTAR